MAIPQITNVNLLLNISNHCKEKNAENVSYLKEEGLHYRRKTIFGLVPSVVHKHNKDIIVAASESDVQVIICTFTKNTPSKVIKKKKEVSCDENFVSNKRQFHSTTDMCCPHK